MALVATTTRPPAALIRQSAEPVPHVTANQGARRTHRQHLVDVVTLTLIDLDAVHAGVDVTRGIDRPAGFEQSRAGPVAHLRADHPDRR
jgi:hypothetical protein